MRQVLYALIPGVIAYTWFFGLGMLVQIALAAFFALVFETAMLKARRQPLDQYLGDGSAAVTAVLFALCLPPLAPWWIACIGMFFAIVVAKHLYGGLGHNIFNPAMAGYVVVLISFPQALTLWLPPSSMIPMPSGPLSMELGNLSLADTLFTILTGSLPPGLDWDAISQATPLDILRTSVAGGQTVGEARQSEVFGDFGGRGWEWIANWYALGGLWLMWRRIITWHVPVALIASVVVLGLVAFLADPGSNPSPLQHVFSGGVMLGAFFIATDPVSGCTSTRGRLIFGAGVGIITLVIRRWGGYPDGVAFAVLMLNMMAPLIDRYTKPRIHGR
jgi:electron transport complex protein RnfD